MCEFCENIDDGVRCEKVLCGGRAKLIAYKNISFSLSIDGSKGLFINFCPICGRDLREKGEKTEKIICKTNPKCEYNPEECIYAIGCIERVKALDENGHEYMKDKRFYKCASDKCKKGE